MRNVKIKKNKEINTTIYTSFIIIQKIIRCEKSVMGSFLIVSYTSEIELKKNFETLISGKNSI